MKEDKRRGLVIVHTGPGKGKTTAALGLAFRAVGSGLRVLMVQFIKGSWHYGELDAAQAFGDKFVIRPMGKGFVKLAASPTRSTSARRKRLGRSRARRFFPATSI